MESNEVVYPHLEKRIVDLYCDKLYPNDKTTFYKILKKLYFTFSINETPITIVIDTQKNN